MHNLSAPLEAARQAGAHKRAVTCGEIELTNAQLVERCQRLGAALRARGLEPGDRVAILAPNCHRYIEVYAGVPAAGFVVVPLNTRHAEPEVLYALEDSGAKVLITDRDPAPYANAVPHLIRMPDDYEEALAEVAPAAFAYVHENDLAGLFYTGGTTGASKGVMLTHRNLIANTFHWLSIAPIAADECYLLMAPAFHAAGSNAILATLWTGGRHVILGTFEPGAALDLIESERVTMTLGVPTMLAALAEEQRVRPRDTSSVTVVAHGGSPIATEVVRLTHETFPNAELIHVYGATETAPLATGLRREENLLGTDRARSCGQPVAGVAIRILDTDGKEVPIGEIGEVAIRGPNVMQGYWKKEEQTAAVLKDGWYWSGDLGYMDDEAFVFLVDRTKDMIVSGGENVYSTEVEEVLYQHPDVLEAAVFGVPDDQWGEAVHAVVVPRAEAGEIDVDALREFCRERIAGYKVPKGIDLRADALPKSGPGKVLKRELRAPFWEGRDRQVS
jgi:long-chain acyl-CoA synthetase